MYYIVHSEFRCCAGTPERPPEHSRIMVVFVVMTKSTTARPEEQEKEEEDATKLSERSAVSVAPAETVLTGRGESAEAVRCVHREESSPSREATVRFLFCHPAGKTPADYITQQRSSRRSQYWAISSAAQASSSSSGEAREGKARGENDDNM